MLNLPSHSFEFSNPPGDKILCFAVGGTRSSPIAKD